MRRGAACLAALAFCAVAPSARAHDFWIEPSSWRPAAGEPVEVRFRVGESFRGEEVPLVPARIERFEIVSGEPGVPTRGAFRIAAPGPRAVVYSGSPVRHTMDRVRFLAYLREVGSPALIAVLSSTAGALTGPIDELYARDAKALLGGIVARPLGLPLEIVPRFEAATASDAPRPFDLLLEGLPLADVRVVARPAADPEALREGRTDRRGRVRLRLDRPGPWLVTAVHVRPGEREWTSRWASLTLALDPPTGAASASR